MKKVLFLAGVMALATSAVYAGSDLLHTDANGRPVQIFTPKAAKSQKISSAASQNISQSGVSMWAVQNNGADCSLRIMNNSTKASWPQFKLPQGGSYGAYKDPDVNFVNISGCTDVDYQAQ